ncbi:hypothetical protein G9A89_020419 [Geosiphon pyriformis]|nr:hypothetical protein G9A89_020419 [Geosiphon pyriformis]
MGDYSYLPQQSEKHFETHNKNDLNFIELNSLSFCLICFSIENQFSRQFQDFWNWFLNKHSAETYTAYTTYYFNQIAVHQAIETPFETEEESYQTAPVFDLLLSKSDSFIQTVTPEPIGNNSMQANILATLQSIQTALERRNNTPLPLFRGDTQDPIEWLDDFERAAIANQYNDEYKFQIVGGYLQGSPTTWFSQKTDANAQHQIIRWTLLQAFIWGFKSNNKLITWCLMDVLSPKSSIQQQKPISTSTNIIDYLQKNESNHSKNLESEKTESKQEETTENKKEMTTAYIAKISEFTGKNNDTSPQKWLNKVQKAEDPNGWNTAKMLKAIPYFLQRTAKEWFENLEEPFENWQAFKNAFLQQFTDNNTSITLQNCFHNIKQETSKTVITYLGRFNKLLQQIQQLKTNEYYFNAQILDQFIAELKNKLIKKVHLHVPEDLATAIRHAKNYEMAMKKANHTKLVNLAIRETSSAAKEKINQLTKKLMQQLQKTVDRPAQTVIVIADGIKKTPVGEINNFLFTIDGITILVKVLVMDALQYQVLIGNNWLFKANTNLDWKTQELKISYQEQYTRVPATCGIFNKKSEKAPVFEFKEEKKLPVTETFMTLESLSNWAEETEQEIFEETKG